MEFESSLGEYAPDVMKHLLLNLRFFRVAFEESQIIRVY